MPIDISMLDKNQRAAVYDTDGPVLIWAGAGSGKTRVVAARVANLLDRGVGINELLNITFTVKAAEEMRSRIQSYSDQDVSNLWVSTIHSCCNRILREHGDSVLVPKYFSILSETDATAVIRMIMSDLGIDHKEFNVKDIQNEISRVKREALRPLKAKELMTRRRGPAFTHALGRILTAYKHELRVTCSLDYDDLILNTVTLLQNFEDTRQKVSSQFRYIHVDEYQDTSDLDAELVRLLCSAHGNICVVGDANQAIYGFRGSNPKEILNFSKTYKGASVHVLDTNYRSCRSIVDTAGCVISNNRYRPDYTCQAHRQEPGTIIRTRYKGDIDEAQGIAATINRLVKTEGIKYSDIAVLVRTHQVFRPIEKALVDYSIPYEKVAGVESFGHPETKCVVDFLKLLINDSDDTAARYILDKLGCGVGKVTVDKLKESARADGISFLEACKKDRPKGVSGQAWTSLQKFHSTLTGLKTMMESGSSLSEMLEVVIADWIRPYCDEKNSEVRWANIDALREVASNYNEPAKNIVMRFLETAALSGKETSSTEKVQLMTIHASKGLEFRVVFLPAAEEGIIPHPRSVHNDEELEEERRLFYVAVTRASEAVHVSSCEIRVYHGRYRWNAESRFIEEMDLEERKAVA